MSDDEIKVNSKNTTPRKNLATLGQVKDALNKRDEKIDSLKEDLVNKASKETVTNIANNIDTINNNIIVIVNNIIYG